VKYTCIKIISAPHSANAIAASCPIPLVPPVIKAVCPSRENIENAEAVAILENDVYFSTHVTLHLNMRCFVYLRVEILPLHSDERAEKWGKLPL
jgi:hypothetical protein